MSSWFKRWLSMLAGVALFGIIPLAAASNISPWFARTWLTEDGLPDNNVTGVAQSADGFLWISTHIGLARFDGAQFEKIPLPKVSGRSDLLIRALLLTDNHTLWLAAEGGVVEQLTPNATNVFTTADGLSNFRPMVLARENSGAVWLGYSDGSACEIAQGKMKRIFSLPGTGQCWLTADTSGQIWFAKAGRIGLWLGHFSDNELPLKPGLLTKYLTLPPADPGVQAAQAWLRTRHGATASADSITDQDDRDFLGFVVARYYRIVSAAIKKYDPNHLFLGSRFHGKALAVPEIFRAAVPYADVVSVNYYNAWTPDATRLAAWERGSHKPILVTEFYVKAEDSGMGNLGGAGWIVKSQRARGEFYENFTLGLVQSKVCVGWQWFKYIDNDPADTKSDPSNRDANKGLLNNRYEPYTPLLDSMKAINERVYSLAAYFDGRPMNTATAEASNVKRN